MKIWLLHIDSDHDRSVDVYTDEEKALADFERALEIYVDLDERERFKGDPRAASLWLQENSPVSS